MKATVTSHLLPKPPAPDAPGAGRTSRMSACHVGSFVCSDANANHLLDRPRDNGMRLDADQRLLHVATNAIVACVPLPLPAAPTPSLCRKTGLYIVEARMIVG